MRPEEFLTAHDVEIPFRPLQITHFLQLVQVQLGLESQRLSRGVIQPFLGSDTLPYPFVPGRIV